MRDLAVDASSDSNKNADARAALQSQVESALTTIDQIAVNTKYAGRALLDGSAGASRTILDPTAVAGQNLTSVEGNGNISVSVSTAAEKAISESATSGAVVAGSAVDGTGSIDLDGGELKLTINGKAVKATDAMGGGDLVIDGTTTWQQLVDSINQTASLQGEVTAEITADGELAIMSAEFGSDQHVSVQYTWDSAGSGSEDLTGLLDASGSTFEADAGVDAVADVVFGGEALGGGSDVTFGGGSGLTISHATYGSITLTEAAGTTTGDYVDVISAQDGQLSFQVG
jgi:flagellin